MGLQVCVEGCWPIVAQAPLVRWAYQQVEGFAIEGGCLV